MEIEAASVRANCIIRRKLLIESLILVLALLIIAYFPCTCTASEVIPPVSTTVMLGEEAKFSCSGEALIIGWTINNMNIASLGIDSTEQDVDGVLISTLTVIGSAQYDNASIQCVLVTSLGSNHLSPVFLTVLGIGQVPSINLVSPVPDSSLFIQWEKPVFVSTDVTDLTYNVSVIGADSEPMNETTKDTECCHDMLYACQVYNITVTPFSSSSNYVGASNGTKDAINGDYPYLDGQCGIEIIFVSSNNVTCSFTCPVMRPQNACPLQRLSILVDSYSNDESEPFLINSFMNFLNDSIMESVSNLPAGEKCFSNFTLIDLNGLVVSSMVTNFSTYSVQSAKFALVNTRVNATCVFAINASASACQIVFINDSFGLSFGGIVNHSLPESTELIDIPRNILHHETVEQLGSVAFDAQVYDMNMDGSVTGGIAYVLQHALVVRSMTVTTDISGTTTVSSTMPVPSPSPIRKKFQVLAVVGIGAAVLFVIVLLVIVPLSVACYCYKPKIRNKKDTENATYEFPLSKVVPQKTYSRESYSIPENNNAPASNGIQGDLEASMVQESPSPSVGTTTSDTTTTTEVSTGSMDNGTKQCNPAYEDVTIKAPQPNPPTGGSQYADLAPPPLDAPMILPELDRVGYKQIRKNTVEYAELGDRPANAPPVLPPDVGVNYVDVKPTPTAKASLKLDGEKAEHVQSKKDGVVYADLGPRPANAPTVLPPDTSVHYVAVRPTRKPKNCIQGATAFFGVETTISADTSSSTNLTTDTTIPPKLPPKRAGLASKKATSSCDSTNSPQQHINPPLPVEDEDHQKPWENAPEVELGSAGAADDIHMNGQESTNALDDESTSIYRCSDNAGEESSEMALESRRIVTENEDLSFASSPCCDPGSTAPIRVFKVDPVPSFAWKANDEKGNCFRSIELHENEIQLCTDESTFESQSEESGHKLDSGSVETDEHFEKGLCLMTSENYGLEKVCSEAGQLIVASNLTPEVVPGPPPMPCVQG